MKTRFAFLSILVIACIDGCAPPTAIKTTIEIPTATQGEPINTPIKLLPSFPAIETQITEPTSTEASMNENSVPASRKLTKPEYHFALDLPINWGVVEDSFQSMLLAPNESKSWTPESPADIAKDPRIRIFTGKTIRERLGPANFPEKIDADILKQWIEQRNQSGQEQDLREFDIHGIQAFETTVRAIPGCEAVVYWRVNSIEELVRISTGCQSPYLEIFQQITQSLEEIPE